jgi:hypothetical protein
MLRLLTSHELDASCDWYLSVMRPLWCSWLADNPINTGRFVLYTVIFSRRQTISKTICPGLCLVLCLVKECSDLHILACTCTRIIELSFVEPWSRGAVPSAWFGHQVVLQAYPPVLILRCAVLQHQDPCHMAASSVAPTATDTARTMTSDNCATWLRDLEPTGGAAGSYHYQNTRCHIYNLDIRRRHNHGSHIKSSNCS